MLKMYMYGYLKGPVQMKPKSIVDYSELCSVLFFSCASQLGDFLLLKLPAVFSNCKEIS